VEGAGLTAMAVNQNISAGGMLIRVSTKLEEGQTVTLRFKVPPALQEERELSGRILRIESNEEDPQGMFPFRIAVEFDAIDAALVPHLEEAERQLGSE
jgi:hypothetical protein